MSEVKVIKRRITPRQKAKQLHIIAQATHLLALHGSNVSMEMVGEAAQVSRSTLYRYYASREHLLAEVTLEAGNNLILYLEAHTPKGNTVGARIRFLCKQISEMAESSPLLLAACISNLASDDPAVIDAHAEIEQLISGIFKSVSGDQELNISASIQGAIFRYLLGSFMLATTGKLAFNDLANDLANLCECLMSNIWDIKCS